MERIVHRAISVDKTNPTEIAVTKAPPMLVTDVITIEKPRHIEVTVAKGSVGVNGRNGVDGRNGADGINGRDGKDGLDGMDGQNGKDGGVFIPHINEGMLSWDFSQTSEGEYPVPVNVFANIDSITNLEIYNVVNGD